MLFGRSADSGRFGTRGESPEGRGAGWACSSSSGAASQDPLHEASSGEAREWGTGPGTQAEHRRDSWEQAGPVVTLPREKTPPHTRHTRCTRTILHHAHTHHVRPHPMQKHTRTPHTQPDLSRVSCPLCPQVEALEMEPRPQIRGSSQRTPTCLLSAYQ